MKHRKLRIAWSVGCGIFAVLLVVLWVRSYQSRYLPSTLFQSGDFTICSQHGVLLAAKERFIKDDRDDNEVVHFKIGYPFPKGFQVVRDWSPGPSSPPRQRFRFAYLSLHCWTIQLPFSFLALVAGFSVLAPWIPWRFSLRTLLITTTLVAVGLGMIVWM